MGYIVIKNAKHGCANFCEFFQLFLAIQNWNKNSYFRLARINQALVKPGHKTLCTKCNTNLPVITNGHGSIGFN